MPVYLGEMVKEPICLFIYHWPALAGETDKEPICLLICETDWRDG